MKYYIFIDNSNVWIEGKYASAVEKGYASNVYEAHDRKLQDNSWRIDFGKLLSEVTDNNVSQIEKAIAFGSKPPESDSLWNALRSANFEVIPLERNAYNKEKAVDTGITAEIMDYLYNEAHEGDEFVLVMGDKDFLPVVDKIKKRKCTVSVAFWSNASGELISSADRYINLTPKIFQISH